MNEKIRRRTALQSIGAGIGIATLGSGLTGAQPPSGAQCACPDGHWTVAKYENVEGELVFEKTDIPVLDPSSEFTFSNVQLKEGEDDPEEIASFEWDGWPYGVTHVVVKTGDGCFTTEQPNTLPNDGIDGLPSGTASGTVTIDDLDTNKAISHVEFCAPPYWQVDIANTASPYEIGNPSHFIEGGSGTPLSPNGCIEWLVGGEPSFFEGYTSFEFVKEDFDNDNDLDDDCSYFTVGYTLTDVPPEDNGEVSVIAAISPSYGDLFASNWSANVETQQIFDESAIVHDADDVGEEFTHTVNLPGV